MKRLDSIGSRLDSPLVKLGAVSAAELLDLLDLHVDLENEKQKTKNKTENREASEYGEVRAVEGRSSTHTHVGLRTNTRVSIVICTSD